jgi:hypothetical protein
MHKHIADLTPNPQQPDARTRFPCEELMTRTSNTPIATRNTFHNPTFASAALCQLCQDLGFFAFSLLTAERMSAEVEGRSTGATLGDGRRAGVLPILGSALSPTELLQGPAESQRPCSESRCLSGEPGCWYYSCCNWETYSDRAEDIEWWVPGSAGDDVSESGGLQTNLDVGSGTEEVDRMGTALFGSLFV